MHHSAEWSRRSGQGDRSRWSPEQFGVLIDPCRSALQFGGDRMDNLGRLKYAGLTVRVLRIGTSVFHKRERYSYQQEYRVALTGADGGGHVTLDVGDIRDIAVLMETKNVDSSLRPHFRDKRR